MMAMMKTERLVWKVQRKGGGKGYFLYDSCCLVDAYEDGARLLGERRGRDENPLHLTSRLSWSGISHVRQEY